MLAASMAVFTSCKEKEYDYRDAWVGTYLGDSKCHLSADGGNVSIDTVYYNDSLSVSKREDEGLTIGYRGESLLIDCTKEGKLSFEKYPHSGGEGKIVGDSLYFKYSDSFQGRTITYHFGGSKIRQ